jgi:IclR helix-turn-helix domain.
MSNHIKHRIVNILWEAGKEMSLSHISAETGVSVPTSTKYVNELIEDGLVVKIGKPSSSQGRRPFTYLLNRNAVFL